MIRFAKPLVAGKGTKPTSARTWRYRLAISAGALLTLGALAGPASAKPFQQYLNGNCTGSLCKINFAAVPAGQRLIVSNISCYMRLKQVPPSGFNPEIRASQMLVVGANLTTVVNAITLVPESIGRTDDELVYSANHAVSAFANQNQRFQAYLELNRGSFSQFACHISGDLGKAT
jgi:hypothetical protein